jgi:predicted ATPase/class 3 adenylate cyclase
MSNRSETFGRLLKGAINSIAAYEGKTAPAIEDELGQQIGVAGSTIQRYKAGYLPTEPRVVQILAEAAVRRGYLSRAWLVRFLQAARYPNPDMLITQFADVFGQAGSSSGEGALPGGTLTFLFTDIESSTTRWEHQPQAMERALARHDQLLRQVIDAYGGQVIKTVGDAFQVVFTTAPAALEAALAAQHALAAEAWGPIEPIRARMALHVGMVQQRDGDYFGQPMNRVARLCTAGHGGQVLLSNAAQELVRDALPKGTQLRDLGEHRLKDLVRPERIFQIVAPDLPLDFPALRTLERYTHNLPAQATPLIGREAEVLAVCDLVRRDNVRLLTLTGPGGIGKTRLALQAAADLLDDFRDGVYFVPLAPIRDPELVLQAIAQALGVSEAVDKSLSESIKAFLRQRQTLLLLDNFEQVLDAAPQIAALLAAAPELKVLATSREVLHLYGEHEYEVPPLSLPDLQHLPPIERLTQYEAVRLFIERAQAVRLDFAVTGENAPAIAEICVRLDGLPLAIELAAARSKLFPPKALLARLDKRLALLTGGPRDLPARQQTLRNAIAWSYDLLDPAEQAIFARLGVFVGGCTLEAAEAVLADEGAADAANLTTYIPASAVLDGLASLVDKSLLKEVESVGDTARFVMLETIREFALERLETNSEMMQSRERHAHIFADLAHHQVAEHESTVASTPDDLQLAGSELENLRAAMRWALEHHDTTVAEPIYWLLGTYLQHVGLWTEHTHLDESMLHLSGTSMSSALRAKILGDVAWFAVDRGDDVQAQAYVTEGYALVESQGDELGVANMARIMAQLALNQGDYTLSLKHLHHSLDICQRNQDPPGIAISLLDLGILHLARNEAASAEQMLLESLSMLRTLDSVFGIIRAQAHLAHTSVLRGDRESGMTYLHACLAYEPLRDYEALAIYPLNAAAILAHACGSFESTARILGFLGTKYQAIGPGLLTCVRAMERRAYDESRTALGETAWQVEQAAGQVMTLEQAIAEALAITS